MKVYVTKYCLKNQGIEEMEAERCEGYPDSIRPTNKPNDPYLYFHGEGKEWHRTLEDAIDRAEEMRTARICSLEKQIKKLHRLTFKSK